MDKAKLVLNDKEYELPLISGTENEVAVDIRKLRESSGIITYDPGYANTGSCRSAITFIDSDREFSISWLSIEIGRSNPFS